MSWGGVLYWPRLSQCHRTHEPAALRVCGLQGLRVAGVCVLTGGLTGTDTPCSVSRRPSSARGGKEWHRPPGTSAVKTRSLRSAWVGCVCVCVCVCEEPEVSMGGCVCVCVRERERSLRSARECVCVWLPQSPMNSIISPLFK